MSTDYKFEGWAGFDKDSVKGNLRFVAYEPKKWNEDDIDGKLVEDGGGWWWMVVDGRCAV